MKVPFLDFKAAYQDIKEELDDAYHRVMASGVFILGPELEKFEKEFALYCGTRHCVGVGSGLDALYLILKSLGIGPGDEVIVPGNTYIATWLAVTHAGATPVPVEPDDHTFNLIPGNIKPLITEKTRALLIVHMYGQPADMDALSELGASHKLRMVEDSSHAHGARYKGVRVGSLGDASGFSLYPGKNLGAFGDAGAVTTDNDEIARKIRLLRNYGSEMKYLNEYPGINSRLDELQAAFLRVKLRHVDSWNAHRTTIAERYTRSLSETNLVLPSVPGWAESVWHQYVIRSPWRDLIQNHLSENGIETLIHYPVPPHLQKAYLNQKFPPGSLPVTEKMAAEVLSLPIGPHLSMENIISVTNAVKMIKGQLQK